MRYPPYRRYNSMDRNTFTCKRKCNACISIKECAMSKRTPKQVKEWLTYTIEQRRSILAYIRSVNN